MTFLSVHVRLALVIFLFHLLLNPCLAQRALRDVNDLPWDDDPSQSQNQVAKVCAHGASFLEMAMSIEDSCDKADSVEVILPLPPDSQGHPREKRIRGAYEFHEYRLHDVDQENAFSNLVGLIPMAGFVVKYSSKPSVITAQKENTWVLINVGGESYEVSLVREVEVPWTPVTTAEEISREMQTHGRAEIYGIQFSSNQGLEADQSPILLEILKYLERSPDLSVVIESHKVSKMVPPEADSEITRERSNAVMDWLLTHGISRTRLQPRAFGRDNPLTENDTPGQIQRNERISLAKAKIQGQRSSEHQP